MIIIKKKKKEIIYIKTNDWNTLILISILPYKIDFIYFIFNYFFEL
jgi:hypothetical protein